MQGLQWVIAISVSYLARSAACVSTEKEGLTMPKESTYAKILNLYVVFFRLKSDLYYIYNVKKGVAFFK